jgi:phosphoserine phosphatase
MNNYNLLIVDLDKTIIFGDSVVAFSNVLIEEGLLELDFWTKKKSLDYDGNYFSLLKKQQIHDIYVSLELVKKNKVLNYFIQRKELKPINEVIDAIESFRNRGYKILVTTASLDFLVLPLLKKISFQYDYLHCSSFDGFSSENIISKLNNSGITKLQCVKDLFILIGKPKEIIVFTDHFSDLPLLLIGNNSFVVKKRGNVNDDWTEFFDFSIIFHSDV